MAGARTQDEIVERIRMAKPRDPLGFEWHEYVIRLDFEHATEFLKPDSTLTKDEWESDLPSSNPEDVRKVLRDYIEFAWHKANHRRGISAGRSIMHCIAWSWLAGDDELTQRLEASFHSEAAYEGAVDFCFYGKPQLVQICRYYGIPWRDLDDDEWTNNELAEACPSANRALESLGMPIEDPWD